MNRHPVNRQPVNRQPVNRQAVNRQLVQQAIGELATGESLRNSLGICRNPSDTKPFQFSCSILRNLQESLANPLRIPQESAGIPQMQTLSVVQSFRTLVGIPQESPRNQ